MFNFRKDGRIKVRRIHLYDGTSAYVPVNKVREFFFRAAAAHGDPSRQYPGDFPVARGEVVILSSDELEFLTVW